MADQKTSLPIYSRAASKPVAVSKDTSANAIGNPIYAQLSDGVDKLDLAVVNSAFGATPVALPIVGKYEAVPTAYDDGDAVPILVDENGRIQVDIGSINLTSEYAEDADHTSGDKGLFVLGVRKDARESLAGTADDYTGFVFNGSGELYVIDTDSKAELQDVNTELDTITSKLADIIKSEDAAHASGNSGIQALAVRKDLVSGALSSNVSAEGDYASLLQDGFGSLYVTPVNRLGKANSETSPMFVQVVDSNVSALEVIDYNTAAAVAVDGNSNHDYAVTATKTLKVHTVEVSASGALKIQVLAGPVAALIAKLTAFTSMANPNFIYDFKGALEVADTGTGTIRVSRTNRDDDAMDVYSTVVGYEV